jgi:hypothetical protein
VAKRSAPASSPVSRREFSKQIALVAGAVPSTRVLGSLASLSPESPAAHHGPVSQNDRVQELSADGRLRFETMWQNVLRKHGDRLSDEQKSRLRKIVANNVVMLESVYGVALANGDTPATALLLVEDQSTSRRRTPRSPATGAPPRQKAAGPKR